MLSSSVMLFLPSSRCAMFHLFININILCMVCVLPCLRATYLRVLFSSTNFLYSFIFPDEPWEFAARNPGQSTIFLPCDFSLTKKSLCSITLSSLLQPPDSNTCCVLAMKMLVVTSHLRHSGNAGMCCLALLQEPS